MHISHFIVSSVSGRQKELTRECVRLVQNGELQIHLINIISRKSSFIKQGTICRKQRCLQISVCPCLFCEALLQMCAASEMAWPSCLGVAFLRENCVCGTPRLHWWLCEGSLKQELQARHIITEMHMCWPSLRCREGVPGPWAGCYQGHGLCLSRVQKAMGTFMLHPWCCFLW